MRTIIYTTLIALSAGASTSIAAAAEPAMLDDITVMALGALDGRAVVKTADGKMQVLKLGDTIAGTKAIVSQILNDKLIVEETVAGEGKDPEQQTVWISKPAKPGDKSQIQRFSSQAPPQPVTVQMKLQRVDPKQVEGPPPKRQ